MMFQPVFLKKLLSELESSLKLEFDNVSKKVTEKEKKVFQSYVKLKSLAGMDTWLNHFRELEYFNHVLRELTQEFSNNNLSLFANEIAMNFQEDFGSEDFRFLDWERTEPEYDKLLSVLSGWIFESKKNLNTVQENYIPTQDSLEYYFKSKDDPSQKGANVELIKKKTPKEKIIQIKLAEDELKLLFPYGYQLYKTLTYKIILVQSKGLVSYSHFHEPGISYLNTLDRNLIETIDDLLHENAHHHLNLILKKYKIFSREDTEPRFYSPWRDSLRSAYAILHACFTFSFGLRLFHSILKSNKKQKSKLTEKDFEFARYRFLEETLMLGYSLNDLNQNIQLFSRKGQELVATLSQWQRESNLVYPEIFSLLKEKMYKKKIFDLQDKLEFCNTEYSSNNHGNRNIGKKRNRDRKS